MSEPMSGPINDVNTRTSSPTGGGGAAVDLMLVRTNGKTEPGDSGEVLGPLLLRR